MSSRFSTRRESRSPSPDDRIAQLGPLLRGQGRRAQRRAAGDDRGQRRPQVVGDRAQQGGLQLVAATQRLGLDRLRLHPVALAGERGELGQRRGGLLATALRLNRARAGELGHAAADHRGDHEGGEGDPVLLVGDREPVQRRDVEEVECRRAERPTRATRGASPRRSRSRGSPAGRRSPARPTGATDLSGKTSRVPAATAATVASSPDQVDGGSPLSPENAIRRRRIAPQVMRRRVRSQAASRWAAGSGRRLAVGVELGLALGDALLVGVAGAVVDLGHQLVDLHQPADRLAPGARQQRRCTL